MKKIFLIPFCLFILVAIWYGESRSFFCLPSGQCITVWKTYMNKCYIIPGKYYGIVTPSNGYIETSNTSDIAIFFSKQLPNIWVYKSEHSLKISNKGAKEFSFFDYNSDKVKYDKIFYRPNAQKFSDLNEDADFIEIIVLDNVALDKKGNRL